jgi:hypothetical protein
MRRSQVRGLSRFARLVKAATRAVHQTTSLTNSQCAHFFRLPQCSTTSAVRCTTVAVSRLARKQLPLMSGPRSWGTSKSWSPFRWTPTDTRLLAKEFDAESTAAPSRASRTMGLRAAHGGRLCNKAVQPGNAEAIGEPLFDTTCANA